ncbi:MAG: pyruvate kinase [Actinobacteria bacterium]|nr:pyruvate kinase [Actinomycetota bacterium]
MERKTKIIATIGPATGDRETIGRLVAAGMDVARLNFSHGDHDTHARWAQWVHEASDHQGRAVAVLQDVQGPRIRVGTFAGGSVDLVEGSEVRLVDGRGQGDATTIHVGHLRDAHVGPGSRVVLADGLIHLAVTAGEGGEVRATVVQGGELADRKGAAFPGAGLTLPAITDKDRDDLAFGREIGADLVAASFVSSAADIAAVREVVGDTPVIAKIERAAAYENLAEILETADGAMVARGDLGVELGYEHLPLAQKDIIARANRAGKISITATEMLESMTTARRPTRAEATDVGNAVLDGTDAVMLSAETAIGRHPVDAVRAMDRICRVIEGSAAYMGGPDVDFVRSQTGFSSAIAKACADTADSLGLNTVVAFTVSGSTALLVSKYRPHAGIVAFTPDESTYRRMALLWGVTPLRFERLDSTDEMMAAADRMLLERGMVAEGEWVAMTAGVPPNQRASTNLLKMHVAGGTGAAG